MTENERVWSRVDTSQGESSCWPWIGQRDPDGYGRLTGELAHRRVWTSVHGDIPDGFCVLHHCDNPPCVNPAHLYLGTQADNMADRVRRGRHRNQFTGRLTPKERVPEGCYQGVHPGITGTLRKLTPDAVRGIRAEWEAGAATQRELARQFGVSPSNIQSIVSRRTWRHVA
jgi:hypothetical protein